jgi:hypothetical protein
MPAYRRLKVSDFGEAVLADYITALAFADGASRREYKVHKIIEQAGHGGIIAACLKFCHYYGIF